MRKVGQAEGTIDRLRSSLDGQLARDFPAEFDPVVYYPAKVMRPAV